MKTPTVVHLKHICATASASASASLTAEQRTTRAAYDQSSGRAEPTPMLLLHRCRDGSSACHGASHQQHTAKLLSQEDANSASGFSFFFFLSTAIYNDDVTTMAEMLFGHPYGTAPRMKETSEQALSSPGLCRMRCEYCKSHDRPEVWMKVLLEPNKMAGSLHLGRKALRCW